MIYVPDLNENFVCYSFIDNNTIRAYKSINLNSNNDYIDIYINSHYLTNNGTTELVSQPNCIDNDRITHDWKERNDLSDILIISALGICFFFILPLLIFRRLFKRGGI